MQRFILPPTIMIIIMKIVNEDGPGILREKNVGIF